MVRPYIRHAARTSSTSMDGLRKGIPLIVPIEPQLSHGAIHDYANGLADRLADTNRRRYTTVAGERHRVGRIFIDYLRMGGAVPRSGRTRRGRGRACRWRVRPHGR